MVPGAYTSPMSPEERHDPQRGGLNMSSVMQLYVIRCHPRLWSLQIQSAARLLHLSVPYANSWALDPLLDPFQGPLAMAPHLLLAPRTLLSISSSPHLCLSLGLWSPAPSPQALLQVLPKAVISSRSEIAWRV